MNIFNKEVLSHHDFYIVKFTKNRDMPYLLFIHGGPGFNCGIIEYLIEHNGLFGLLNHNIILYDQRNCGRSRKFNDTVLHQDNVNDLHEITQYLADSIRIKIHGLIGHSYGAKLLFDYYNKFHSTIPGIFVSTTNSILVPRLNNLMLDLAYLKKTNPTNYNETIKEMDNLDIKKLWEISEKLDTLFQENKARPYFYWANLEYFEVITEIQKHINLPINTGTFTSVRKDLYSDESNFSVQLEKLTAPNILINGFHDYIINGAEGMLSKNPKTIIFYKSSHYPHIEENNLFNETVNEFIGNIRS